MRVQAHIKCVQGTGPDIGQVNSMQGKTGREEGGSEDTSQETQLHDCRSTPRGCSKSLHIIIACESDLDVHEELRLAPHAPSPGWKAF